MPVVKPIQKQEAQKQAVKLFAAGYRPLKNSVYPRIGKFDLKKIRARFGAITPYVLHRVAGVNAYTINRIDINPDVYYALFRLTKNATIETYRILSEQLNENG